MAHDHDYSSSPLSRRRSSWRLAIVGLNHKTASQTTRETIQISPEDVARFEARLFAQPGVLESALVVTCNRIEFYLVCDKAVAPFTAVARLYEELRGLDIAPITGHFYEYEEREAVAHLFRVAAGIDSMVLGENQILGQLKDAYSSACQLKTAGKVLQRAFHQAFRVGKQARSDTSLGRGACSISSAAVALLETRLDRFPDPNVLLVGAGKMISLAASRLTSMPIASLRFVNRTRERAEALAGAFGAAVGMWRELPDEIASADIVISCTGSPEAVISQATLDHVSHRRNGRPQLLLDLAIPADIEWQADRYGSITCLSLDDIKEFAEQNQSEREAEIPRVEAIIAQRLDEFMYWYTHVHREISVSTLEASLETVRQQELKRVLAKLPLELQTELNDASRHLVEKLMQIHHRVDPTADKGA